MWNAIVESFSNLTPILWVSQIMGLIGLAIIGVSYLFKKKTFLIISTISFVFFVFESIFAGLWVNMISTTTCLIRNVLMTIFLIRKDKELPRYVIYILLSMMIITEFIYMGVTSTLGIWDNYLPICLVIFSTFTQNSKNEYIVKEGALVHETGFLVYYICYNLPFSILRQIILVVSCLVGLILLIVHNNKNRNHLEVIDNNVAINK
jgi:hypothetical protein